MASFPVVLLFSIFLAPLFFLHVFAADKVLMCYYAEWAIYRTSPGTFYPSNIMPELCTHIVYSYMGMNDTTFQIQSRDPWGDFEINKRGLIVDTVELKELNPKLKVLVSVGGWSEGSVKFSGMASSPSSRSTFIESAIAFIKKHQFDGLDMAWEYPADRGGLAKDKINYAKLLKEMRKRFDAEGLLLTAQLFHKRYIIDSGYDIPSLSESLHYISFVTYQYHTPGEMRTGAHAPMKSSDFDNVEKSLEYILRKGAPREKLLLGFSTYGHQYIMNQKPTNGKYFNVPADKTYEGPWSKESGFIGYNEVCNEITKDSNWRELWDEETFSTYAVNDDKFISYENVASYKEKLKLLRKNNLAGAFVWSIDTDDFKGLCSEDRYPLIGEIKYFLEHWPQIEKENTPSTSHIVNITVVSHEYGKK